MFKFSTKKRKEEIIAPWNTHEFVSTNCRGREGWDLSNLCHRSFLRGHEFVIPRRRERERERKRGRGCDWDFFFTDTSLVYGLLIELFASTDPESNGGIDKRRGIVPGKQR